MADRNDIVDDDMVNLQSNMSAGDALPDRAIAVADSVRTRHDGVSGISTKSDVMYEKEADFDEPGNGIAFDSHEAAYSFYQKYAKSMGFTTSIKNSRRSKKSKEFIDAKFACSRYGVTPDSDGASSSRRSCVRKTDCKASMHVKRKPDGKWITHEFVKEHNHELLPVLAYHFRIHRNIKLAEKNNIDILHAVSERTKKIYAEMSRQYGGFHNVQCTQSDVNSEFENGHHLALDEGEGQVLLEYFKRIKKENPDFFYAIDLNKEQRLRNVFWIDGKSRSDYVSFNDAVSFDTFFVKYHEKLPLAPFVGVNHHCQPILLGCAFLADETKSTFVWLMRTWLRAMGRRAPKVIISDMDKTLKAAIKEVFPNSQHCFSLWHILERIHDTLSHVIKTRENFMSKFNKCIFKSWTEEQFDMRWWKMVTRFELQDDEWIQLLYADRQKWVPTYVRNTFLAGLSAPSRAETMTSFLDKYIHRKMTLKEFMRQYGTILQNHNEEELLADFDTLHKQPALKSPSPWEKQMSMIYTHSIFKKFQFEVLGVVGCHPKKESEDGMLVTYKVQDCEKDEKFLVTWDKTESQVACLCHLFEYKGFLCRHALIVLQIWGCSSIPSQYILKRWTKDTKSKESMAVGTENIQSRVQRYNELCRLAIEMSREGSLSEESYNVAFRTLVDALKSCVDVNDSNHSIAESNDNIMVRHETEEENARSLPHKSSKKKKTIRKGKSDPETLLVEAPDTLQQMENLSTEGITLNGYYGPQRNTQGLTQLNLMEPPSDGYYVNQQSFPSLGQLNSIAPGHDGFFRTQHSMHGLGQFNFQHPTTFTYGLQDDSHLRPSKLHGSTPGHS